MNLELIHTHCQSKKGVTAGFPFDKDTLVFKVMNKMFLLTGLQNWEAARPFINVKCDPVKAKELRGKYEETVTGAYHMSKVHWNSIHLDGSMPQSEVLYWIDHSYNLVAQGLKKADRITLENL